MRLEFTQQSDSNGTSANPAFTRREALRALAALASSATLLPMVGSRTYGADAPAQMTSEPPGNPALDHSLTNFEFAPLVTTKLSDSLALLSGPGGNMAVLVGASGALLVDSGVHPTARALAMGAAAFAEKPVTTVVNTHWHFDHTGGNEYFGKQGCAIVAHQNVRNRMGHDQKIEQFDFTFRASPTAALPSITFPDSLTLYSESEPVELHHVDPAHTDGDILVYFPKTNVLHMGDTFFNAFYPFIDYSTGGWIGGMAAAADRGLALCNAETRIIPGHGPLGSKAELAAFREMLVTTQGRLEKLLGAGKGVDDIVAAAPIKDLEEKWGHGFFTSDLFVRNATLGLMRHRQAAG